MMDNSSREVSWKEGLDTGLLQERIGIQKEQTLDWIEIKNMLLDSWKKQGKHGFLYEENIMPTMDKPKVEKEPQRKDLQKKYVLATQEITQEHIFGIAIIFAIAAFKTINEDSEGENTGDREPTSETRNGELEGKGTPRERLRETNSNGGDGKDD